LDDLRELEIDGLTVRIDRLICVGFEDCIVEAPEMFALDDDGIAKFTDSAAAAARERLMAAARSCPVDAIVVLDESGNQVHP
jgi:ferredoxin